MYYTNTKHNIVIKPLDAPIRYKNKVYVNSICVDNILVFIATPTKTKYIINKLQKLDFENKLLKIMLNCL